MRQSWRIENVPRIRLDSLGDDIDIGFLEGDDHRRAFTQLFCRAFTDIRDLLDGADLVLRRLQLTLHVMLTQSGDSPHATLCRCLRYPYGSYRQLCASRLRARERVRRATKREVALTLRARRPLSGHVGSVAAVS